MSGCTFAKMEGMGRRLWRSQKRKCHSGGAEEKEDKKWKVERKRHREGGESQKTREGKPRTTKRKGCLGAQVGDFSGSGSPAK